MSLGEGTCMLQPAIASHHAFAREMEDMIKLQAIMTPCTLLLCTWLPGNLGGIQAQGQMPGSSMCAFYQHPYFPQFVRPQTLKQKRLFFLFCCIIKLQTCTTLFFLYTGSVSRISIYFKAVSRWIDFYTIIGHFFNCRVRLTL